MLNVFVLSINQKACQKMLSHLKAHGFGEVEVVEGVRPRAAKPTVEERHECICKSHYKCTEKFARERRQGHFMLLEDDCRFTVPDAFGRIAKALGFLDANKKWGSLHVGQTPFGPVFPVWGASFLCRTMNPHGGHCYVLNRDTVLRLIKKVPPHKWKRPHMVEGLRKVPPFERFAFFPSIAIQNKPPKEMKIVMEGIPLMTYKTATRTTEWVAASMTGIGFVILSLAVTMVVFRVLTNEKIQGVSSARRE